MRLGLRIVNIVMLMVAVGWCVSDFSWEPGLAVIGLLSTLIFQEVKKPRDKPPFDQTYQTSQSYDFYNVIARSYDERNSALLLKTHREVTARIEKYVDGRSAWQVLDLGGGTGLLIANHFANDKNGTWVSVDSSSEMNAQFNRNLSEVKLSISVIPEMIGDYLDHPGHYDKEFDVVVLSLVLTSMPSDPQWSKVVQRVKKGGALIVADIEPSYATLHPHFALTVNDKTYALATRQVHYGDVINAVTKAGLAHRQTQLVKERHTVYSYVCVFERPQS